MSLNGTGNIIGSGVPARLNCCQFSQVSCPDTGTTTDFSAQHRLIDTSSENDDPMPGDLGAETLSVRSGSMLKNDPHCLKFPAPPEIARVGATR